MSLRNLKAISMENLNTTTTFKQAGRILLACLILFAVSSFIELNAQQTLKVIPPSEAKPLAKDSVDNFVSFSPVFAEGKTYLRWLVENDKKDGVFIVERSADGEAFEALAFKDRVGTDKSVKLFYSWIDENPPSGFAHYRVMQVGTDHTFNYSDVVRVKTGAAQATGGSADGSVEPAKK